MSAERTTSEKMAAAMRAGDFAALGDLIAPDAVLRSPITASYEFRGRENIVELLQIVRDSYESLDYTDVVETDGVGVQVFRARVDGEDMEGLDLMRIGPDGRVNEFTVFFRPLPGLARLTATLAARIAGRQSAAAGRATGVLVRPLVLMTRVGDRVALRLLKASFSRSSRA